ncbi:MAG: putative CXXCH cytochrome family protein [Kiritimatiellia bacterium]|jgi:predicted CXXCH cytochrome family protein
MKAFLQLRPCRWAGRFAVAGVLLLTLVGCATKRTHQEWLEYWFDGVPPLEGETAKASPNGASTPKVKNARDRPIPVVFRHTPYFENDCAACHTSAFSQKLNAPLAEVCFSCHDNFLTKAKVVHAPEAEGSCLECHEAHEAKVAGLLKLPTPTGCYECHDNVTQAKFKHEPAIKDCGECHTTHVSAYPGLLKLPTPQGCYECHDSVTEKFAFKHEPAIKDCAECHTAHASEFAGLLKLPTPEGCYECHDSVTDKLAFKHEPAIKDCGECHATHASDFAGLLKLDLKATCYECHDQKDTEAVPVHALNPNISCSVCHSPHGGADQYYLRHAPAPGPPGGQP